MTRKLSFSTKLKMWRDYLQYLVFLQQGETLRILLEILIFAASVYLLHHDLISKYLEGHGEQTISIIAILIIIKFIWEAYTTKNDINSYFHIQRSILRNNLTKPFVQPGKKEQEVGFEAIEIPGNKADLIFASEKLSRFITTTPLTINISDAKKQNINKYIQRHREILLQYLNHYFFTSLHNNRPFTNDKKLCLSKDITLSSTHVTCHPGGYYDSFVTNQVAGTTLFIKDKVHTTITTEHIFPSEEDEDGKHYLYNIASSQMNDHIGCSTIGFTSDHYLILWVQGSHTQFNSNLLIPTGSGSCNFSDLTSHNLQKTVIKAMERELDEETITNPEVNKDLNRTKLLGFYRWVTRGGKPEFTGITRLPGTSQQYKPNPKEARTDKQSELKIEVKSIDDLPSAIKEIRQREKVSTPLYMCLYQLEKMYQTHKQELENFMYN